MDGVREELWDSSFLSDDMQFLLFYKGNISGEFLFVNTDLCVCTCIEDVFRVGHALENLDPCRLSEELSSLQQSKPSPYSEGKCVPGTLHYGSHFRM